jgi:cysteine synthase
MLDNMALAMVEAAESDGRLQPGVLVGPVRPGPGGRL